MRMVWVSRYNRYVFHPMLQTGRIIIWMENDNGNRFKHFNCFDRKKKILVAFKFSYRLNRWSVKRTKYVWSFITLIIFHIPWEMRNTLKHIFMFAASVAYYFRNDSNLINKLIVDINQLKYRPNRCYSWFFCLDE